MPFCCGESGGHDAPPIFRDISNGDIRLNDARVVARMLATMEALSDQVGPATADAAAISCSAPTLPFPSSCFNKVEEGPGQQINSAGNC